MAPFAGSLTVFLIFSVLNQKTLFKKKSLFENPNLYLVFPHSAPLKSRVGRKKM